MITGQLCFAGREEYWDFGGRANIDPQSQVAATLTYVRLWLITWGQFEDVVAQENGLPAGAVRVSSQEAISLGQTEAVGVGANPRYPLVLVSRIDDDVPVVTVSCALDQLCHINAPVEQYVEGIVLGLRESHGLSAGDIAQYLLATPGIAGVFSAETMEAIVHNACQRTT